MGWLNIEPNLIIDGIQKEVLPCKVFVLEFSYYDVIGGVFSHLSTSNPYKIKWAHTSVQLHHQIKTCHASYHVYQECHLILFFYPLLNLLFALSPKV